MEVLAAVVGVAMVGLLGLVTVRLIRGRGQRTDSTPGQFADASDGTLEEKLETLAHCGIRLAPPFAVVDLLESHDRDEYEMPGFDRLLEQLAITEEREPWRPHCVNLWQFDAECIEDHGAYRRIAERMVEAAQGSLPLENIRDHVDVGGGEAWLSFTLQGQPIRINCKVSDDWVDPALLSRFAEILERCDPSKLLIYFQDGQNCTIGCVTKEQFESLRKLTSVFEPAR